MGGFTVSRDDIIAFSEWADKGGAEPTRDSAYRPCPRVDAGFSPACRSSVDLAAMRDGFKSTGRYAQKITAEKKKKSPRRSGVDHSVMIDEFGNPRAFQNENV